MSLEQSRWTSDVANARELSCPDWLHTDRVLSELGGVEGYRQYIEEIQQGRRQAPNEFSEVLFGRRRASEAFIVKQVERVVGVVKYCPGGQNWLRKFQASSGPQLPSY